MAEDTGDADGGDGVSTGKMSYLDVFQLIWLLFSAFQATVGKCFELYLPKVQAVSIKYKRTLIENSYRGCVRYYPSWYFISGKRAPLTMNG